MNALGFRPSRKFLYKKLLQVFVVGILALCLSLPVGSWIGDWFAGSEGVMTGRLVALTLNLAWLMPALILTYPTYQSLFYELHEDEVVMHSGLITRRVTHVPIQMITNIEVLRGPFDRKLGLGSIYIQTASSREHTGATERLEGLQNFKEIYDHLTTAIKRFRKPCLEEILSSHSAEKEMLNGLIVELKIIRTLLEGPENQG